MRLRTRHRAAVLEHLLGDVARNAYLLSVVERGGLEGDYIGGPLMGYVSEGRLEGMCCVGSNLSLSSPSSPEAVEIFADFARRAGIPFWVAVGPDDLVDRFMALYGRKTRPVRLERAGQLLYTLRQSPAPVASADGTPLRVAETEDLEQLCQQDREMVTEELGFDPFGPVLSAYRQGWLRRIREGRAWVMGPVGGDLIFKADESASSSHVVQIAGIYTAPTQRRLGLGRAGVGELCGRLLRRVPVVSLFVAADNAPAIALYEQLGFEPYGLVRSVWFQL